MIFRHLHQGGLGALWLPKQLRKFTYGMLSFFIPIRKDILLTWEKIFHIKNNTFNNDQ